MLLRCCDLLVVKSLLIFMPLPLTGVVEAFGFRVVHLCVHPGVRPVIMITAEWVEEF